MSLHLESGAFTYYLHTHCHIHMGCEIFQWRGSENASNVIHDCGLSLTKFYIHRPSPDSTLTLGSQCFQRVSHDNGIFRNYTSYDIDTNSSMLIAIVGTQCSGKSTIVHHLLMKKNFILLCLSPSDLENVSTEADCEVCWLHHCPD